MVEGPSKPVRIGTDKGINLPDTLLDVPALDSTDLEALEVAARLGDLVALSFTRTPNDVEALHAELDRRFADFGVLFKIETRAGFENMSEILLTAMQRPPFGVMIARGDLAVVCGFARLAEVQEEMLCLCEAAPHRLSGRRRCWRPPLAEASRPAPRSPTPPWAAEPSASCSTKGRSFLRRCGLSVKS